MSLRRSLALTCLALATLSLAAQDGPRKDLFGDALPEGALARLGTSRMRNDGGVTAFAFSPDGKSLACAGSNKLTLWDVESGKAALQVRLAANQISGLQYSKDGKLLAVGVSGSESGVQLLDGATLAHRKTLVDPTRKGYYRYSIALSPDAKTVLFNDPGNQTLLLWDAEADQVKHRVQKVGDYSGTPLVFLPDGKHFVSLWTDRKLHLVSVADGKSVRDLEAADSLTATNRINQRLTAAAVSPDGKTLYCRRYNDRAFQVVELATGKLLRTWAGNETGFSPYMLGKLAFSRDGRFLIESSSGRARIWGVASGKALREFGSGSAVQDFALSDDGKRLAMRIGTQITLGDVATGKGLHGEVGHQSPPLQMAFTPDGKRVVSVGSISLRVWDAATGKEEHRVQQYGYNVTHLTADDSSARWVSSDRSVQKFAFSGREATRLTSPRPLTGSYYYQAISPDGKQMAVVEAQSRKFVLLSLEDEKKDRELATLGQNYSAIITYSPDSRYVALSRYTDRSVTLYDAVAGVEVRKLQPAQETRFGGAPVVVFAPDGRSLLKSDGETRVIETSSGGERLRLPRENLASQPKYQWSRDGRLVARGYSDGLVTVHDVYHNKELLRKNTEQGLIQSLALSHDGRRLATGGANTTILIWDVPAPEPLASPLDAKSAWRDLESTDAARGFAALAYYVAQPKEALEAFPERIKSRGAPDPKKIDQMIKDLDDDAFAVREKASEELADLGAQALAKLEEALKDPPSLEVKRRCEVLVRKLQGGATVAPDRLRAIRAVEALERIGSPAAKKVLEQLRKQKMAPDVEAAIDGALKRMG